MRRALILSVLQFLLASAFAQKTQHVVIAVIDGPRFSETFGDSTHQNIPHLWNDLLPLGTFFPNFYNDGVTRTSPGHSSILSGTWQTIANDGTERPHMPTLFEYHRKQTLADSTADAVILGKEKLFVLGYSDHPNYGAALNASVYFVGAQYDDTAAVRNFRNVVAAHHPVISIINLSSTDHSAHTGVWSSYIASLRGADSLVEEMWNTIQADSVFHDRTTLLVTSDHGRHLDGVADGWSNHGDGCAGCRHVALLVVGPDTPAGVVDTSRHVQVDIAPTIGHQLGFPTPYAIGTPIESAFPASVGPTPAPLPLSAELAQNYPNPFNPSTNVSYRLSTYSHVTVRVFDLLGKEVRTLVRGEEIPGEKTIAFDGSGLASGIYLCRLEARPVHGGGSITRTMKMLLIR